MHLLLFQYIFVILLIPMSSLLSVLSPLYFCDKHHHHMKGIAPPVHHHLNGNKDKLTSRPGLPASEDLSDCWDPGLSYLGSYLLCTTCILYTIHIFQLGGNHIHNMYILHPYITFPLLGVTVNPQRFLTPTLTG